MPLLYETSEGDGRVSYGIAGTEISGNRNAGELPDLRMSIARICSANVRMKPLYTDCWLIGSPEEMEETESYRINGGTVTIGRTRDGQTEYNLVPDEYGFGRNVQNAVSETIEEIGKHFTSSPEEPGRRSITSKARGILMKRSDRLTGDDPKNIADTMNMLSETVYRHTMGLGIFDILLSDPRLEDIYADAPCDRNRIHVTLTGANGNSHVRCRTNLLTEHREIQNLISSLKRSSGLPFCESSPVMETDLKEHEARATIVGYPLSPEGNAVAIRKHSSKLWTLTRLIGNGTIDPVTAGLLSFLVDSRSTILINGARGSGKSSLLSALMFEFPLSQRILTIEDTMELPCRKMRAMGYKVQSMLIDEHMEGGSLARSEEALRVSLRMGESAVILGEVRGEEANTLYQSMRTGKAGSSVMGTIHGDSARSVYERVVHGMNIPPEAFMATDTIITMGTRRARGTGRNTREVGEIVSLSDVQGEFVPILNGDVVSKDAFGTPLFRRIASSSGMRYDEMTAEILTRGDMRAFLSETAAANGDEFFGPEWIQMANEFLCRQISSGITDRKSIVNRFKEWFGRYNGIDIE